LDRLQLQPLRVVKIQPVLVLTKLPIPVKSRTAAAAPTSRQDTACTDVLVLTKLPIPVGSRLQLQLLRVVKIQPVLVLSKLPIIQAVLVVFKLPQIHEPPDKESGRTAPPLPAVERPAARHGQGVAAAGQDGFARV
jgi:hypothetical protein